MIRLMGNRESVKWQRCHLAGVTVYRRQCRRTEGYFAQISDGVRNLTSPQKWTPLEEATRSMQRLAQDEIFQNDLFQSLLLLKVAEFFGAAENSAALACIAHKSLRICSTIQRQVALWRGFLPRRGGGQW